MPDPWSGTRREFVARPKSEGLWLRVALRDGEAFEGHMPNRLQDLAGDGVIVSPPEPGSNLQRLFCPWTAVIDLSVRGVIGAAKRSARRKEPAEGQLKMFE